MWGGRGGRREGKGREGQGEQEGREGRGETASPLIYLIHLKTEGQKSRRRITLGNVAVWAL